MLGDNAEFHDLRSAGAALKRMRAEERAREGEAFYDYMQEVIAETEALRAAGRPLSERKLALPTQSPYQHRFADDVADATAGSKQPDIFTLAALLAMIVIGGFLMISLIHYG